jgi:hypothetical protein
MNALPTRARFPLLTTIAPANETEPPRDCALTSPATPGHTVFAAAMDDDGERRRRRESILSDPTTREALRSVVRHRGVPPARIEDVVNGVLADALEDDDLLGYDREHAVARLCTAARNRSIDDARSRKRKSEVEVSPGPEMPDPNAENPEDRTFAHKLIEVGQEKFPRTFPWFWRSRVHGESPASIAAGEKVTPAYVRHEVSHIGRALRSFGVAAAAFFLIVVGIRHWSLSRYDDTGASPRREPVHRTEAGRLTLQGRRECDQERWADCLADLTKASEIDPAGETPEMRELREFAKRKVNEIDAATGR